MIFDSYINIWYIWITGSGGIRDMKTKRHESIAALLEERINARPHEPLPPIIDLAAEYTVAYVTMWKAVRLLARRGVVTSKKGVGTGRGAPRAGAQRRFLDNLRSRILDGSWKSGEQAPKFAYFKSMNHVSNDVVSAAFRALAREDLAHKRGKRWIIGPDPGRKREGPSAHARDPRVVLLLFPTHIDSHNFFIAAHLQPFIANFAGELLKQGVKLEVVRQRREELEPADVVAGIDKIITLIDSLGDRYCGTIAHDIGVSQDYFQQCCAALLGRRKPVIFFDSHDNAVQYTRTLFGGHDRFYRFFLDEAGAVSLAVNTLVRNGHRVIGFPNVPHPQFPWVADRIKIARAAAARCATPPRLLSPPHTERFWSFEQVLAAYPVDYLHERLAAALHTDSRLTLGKQGQESVQRMLLSATPSLAMLLKEGATAIIAANDYTARDYYYWFQLMGIPMPRDMSLVSFDNMPEFVTHPISSIDFGLGRLGYLAAHLLIGDIPVKADGEGQLPGACILVDRGSITAPRKPGKPAI